VDMMSVGLTMRRGTPGPVPSGRGTEPADGQARPAPGVLISHVG
jgi:hypothetical protein